jgi:hypothetical protein
VLSVTRFSTRTPEAVDSDLTRETINAYEEATRTSLLMQLNVLELKNRMRLWIIGTEERTGLMPLPRLSKIIKFLSLQSTFILEMLASLYNCFLMARQPLGDQGLLILEASRSHSFRHTTLSRNPLDEWSAWRRGFYVTTHNTHKRQTSLASAGFEPSIPASEQPKSHALDRAATGMGWSIQYSIIS